MLMFSRNSLYFFFLALLVSNCVSAQKNFSIVNKTSKVTIVYDNNSTKLDSIVANLLAEDIERVTSVRPQTSSDIKKVSGDIIVIGSVQSSLIQKFIGKSAFHKKLEGKWECFGLTIIEKPFKNIPKAFVIAGSDARGTAYGVFTLSEKIGISPWYWWADVPAKQQKELSITQSDFISSSPSVKYRGIFINDEDWGLQPWAAKTLEPETGDIGPKTYAKVFELLLRLKANMIWPAMHPSTKAFFHYSGNVAVAEAYQIIIGSSHAEPMLRNNVDEWNEKTMGHFNYTTNKKGVYKYWEDRVRQSSNINAIYTIGMRGVHDSQMEGVKTPDEAVPLLEQIFKDQRQLLAKYVNKDVTSVPQVFTAYKEVLDIYDKGLKLPEDVTLVWPDDNYGYIQRLNNEKEQMRKGGAGVYYHASYWGRPHDYLWLPSIHPSLMREEMMKAYETGANRLWVLNVGDIKPAEYNIQMFMDMAYNATPFTDSRYPKQHLYNWISSLFGKENAQKIQSILWEYYQLAFQRKPEFMGWSQTEPNTKTSYTEFNHFYFGDEAQKRIDRYNEIENYAKDLWRKIDSRLRDAFFELVHYPVVGASEINKKFLYRDKAYFYSRQNRLSADDYAKMSKNAYDSIVKATEYYNNQLANGKWRNIMSMKPRNLSVYQPADLPELTIDSTFSWGIAPEGFVTKDSSLLQHHNSLSLPSFDNLNKQKYFVDIFLSKHQTLKWTASVSDDWIRLSQENGVLNPLLGSNQTRIWVDIYWDNMSKDEKDGKIIFSDGNNQIAVNVHVAKKTVKELAGYNGFIEDNGFISIQANHFTTQTNRSLIQWKGLDGFGYSDNVLQALPILLKTNLSIDPDSIKRNNAFVGYDFYTFSQATPSVVVFILPTQPVNNNFSVHYAISLDDGPLKIIDTRTFGRSEEWKQNVLRNRAERKTEMPTLNAGRHTLKIYAIDPGVILDEIRIDLGGLKKAYSAISETKMKL
ncbi:MAG TPA: glycosyl hydrolase 115 family protein [Flavisolibacter sp.]|nr:glycosyl hydrolase 115 family protein [Flavisolibacter sp.]